MTPSAPARADLRIDTASLYALLRLALGKSRAVDAIDWQAALAHAERERLIGVIWARSADSIRREAPADVSSAWQKRAVTAGLVLERQLDSLAAAIAALRSHGVSAVVLKGFPLAQRVYGDHTVRPVLDSDLYVPIEQRPDAAHALSEVGWRWTSGSAPEEERFECRVGAQTFVLEVHSSALDDPLLEHVQLPVEQRSLRVGGDDLPAHDGRFLPAYLAAHLAKHHEKPLLWAVDFFLLWSSLDEDGRCDALRAARAVGLGRHLAWAIRIAENIDACRFDRQRSAAAMRRLERSLGTTGNLRRLIRLVALSDSPRASLSVLAGRIWPLARRQGWRAAPGYFLRRGVAWLYRHVVFERSSSVEKAEAARQAIALSDVDCEGRLVSALESASRAWLSPADGSMEPAIPRFAVARVVPLNGRGARRGDVIVRRDARGHCALRRVTALADGDVRVRPDAQHTAEEVVQRAAILAKCDLVDVGGSCSPIERRPHGALSILRAMLRAPRSVSERSSRVLYVYDFAAAPVSTPDSPVHFNELTPDEIRDRASMLVMGGESTMAPNAHDAGCVVGTLSGRNVYHVWYVRGDGARLHGLPTDWRPRGRVLFLHGGYTEPEFRARGIHSAALRWLLARERACETAHAIGVVNADNVPAQRAVESVGFRAVGRVT
jgi:hypothetical protein